LRSPGLTGGASGATVTAGSQMSILESEDWGPQEVHADSEEEKRVHRRFALPLSGRFMRADKREHSCLLRDISVGGASVVHSEATNPVTTGERIVTYVEQLGGLEGTVVQVWKDGFAFRLHATQHKREKLAAQITWLLNEQELQGIARRQHQRVVVGHRAAELVVSDAVSIPCLVLDVSASGASLACKNRPEIDSHVRLLGLRGRVVRHHYEGVGVQFMDVLDLDTVQAYFG